jgi:hypothetical protein
VDDEATDLANAMQLVERLDSLAETAELMGDADGAKRFHEAASSERLRAMAALDD